MIFKRTKLNIVDTEGLLIGRVFQTFNKKKKKMLFNHGYAYFSIRETFVKQSRFIGKKKYNYIIRVLKTKKRRDGSYMCFFFNDTVLIKKRAAISGDFACGPVPRLIRKKKFLTSFTVTI